MNAIYVTDPKVKHEFIHKGYKVLKEQTDIRGVGVTAFLVDDAHSFDILEEFPNDTFATERFSTNFSFGKVGE